MLQRLLLSSAILAIAAVALFSACTKPVNKAQQAPPARIKAPTERARPPAHPGIPPGTPEQKAQPAEIPQGEQPVEPEKNPTGAIPDNQVFVTYKSIPGMYSIQAPEGWTRTENGTDVKFIDKYDGEQITLTKCDKAPTVESVKNEMVPVVEREGHAVKVTEMRSKVMPNGDTACIIVYTCNSDPDPATKKQVRLDNIHYYYYKPGKLATLRLWSPVGVDNKAKWTQISESFAWNK